MNDQRADLLLARTGDGDALKRVLEPWWRPMRRWALVHCGDEALAEDAVQNALIKVLRSIRGFDTSRPFGPWLRTIVRNECLRLTARDHRARRPWTRWLSGPRQPDRQLDMKRSTSRVLQAIAELPPVQRELVELVHLEGFRAVEAAEVVGITAAAARGNLRRARETLKSAFAGGEGVVELLREGT